MPPGLTAAARAALPALLAAAIGVGGGCNGRREATPPRPPREVDTPFYLQDTVGEIARFAGNETIVVQGYGFVTGLNGTGTTIVPPGIRRLILFQMKRHNVDKPEQVLASPNTAVVTVGGRIPPGAGKGSEFDVEVRAVAGTETTSLEGGYLLTSDLTRAGVGRTPGEGGTESAARAAGAIFVPPFTSAGRTTIDPRLGRVLAGGTSLKTRKFRLVLLNPSLRMVDQVERLINARFSGAAKGTADATIDLTVPDAYQDDKVRFLDLVGALYLRESPALRDQRIEALIEHLKTGRDLDTVCLSLEAFGRAVVPKLADLGRDLPPEIKYYVGRTLARLGEARALPLLEPVATDNASPLQVEAIRALGELPRGLGLGVLSRAVHLPDARVRIAAWQEIVEIAPDSTVVEAFPHKFTLSVIPSRADPFVYVSRTDEARVAVFGDMRIKTPALAKTDRVLATAQPEDKQLTLIATRKGRDLKIKVPLELHAAIADAAGPYVEDGAEKLTGLDLSYSDVVGLLHELDQKKAMTGPLVLQPLDIRTPGVGRDPRPIRLGPPEGAEGDEEE